MMPRPQPQANSTTEHGSVNTDNTSTDGSNHNPTTHGGMNVNLNSNVNYPNSRGTGNSAASTSRAGVGDQMRQRYGGHHHGPAGGEMGGAMGAGGGGPAFAAAMSDYSGLASQYNRAAAAGFGPFNPAAGGPGGMNAAMNPSLYPHLGAASAGGMSHQSPQQQAAALGDHLDFRPGSGNAAPGGGGGNTQVAQAEQEEELLLNILIARRQRQFFPPGAGPQPSTSWADDFMRMREQTMSQQQQQQQDPMGAVAGERMPYEGFPQGGGEVSHRSQHSSSASGRMSMGAAGAAGMGHLPNANMNMTMQPNQRQQFFSDSSRLRHRGSGVGFQIGSPQGAWMGANMNPAAMHSPNPPGRSDSAAYAQGGNTQVGMDVLERADRMMPGNMIHDARMAEQGHMGGQNPYHNRFAVGQPFGQEAAMGYGGKLEGGQAMMDKHGGKHSHHQMQNFFGSSQKPPPSDEAQSTTKKKRLHKKKPADMPRRPLSAYNLFFSEERERILKEIEGKAAEDAGGEASGEQDDKASEEGGASSKEGNDEEGKPKALLRPLLPSEKKRRPHRKTHGKISFQLLAQKVGQRWKALPDDQRKYYQDLAQEDMKRQKKAMEEYYQKRKVVTATNEASTTVED